MFTSFSFPVRYQITLLVFLGWVLNLYMRAALSIAIVDMTTGKLIHVGNTTQIKPADFNWTSKEQTFTLSSFNYGYMLSPIGGVLATKYGGATIYGLGVLLTAVFTLITPIVCKFNFYALNVLRVIEGICGASSAASCALIMANWAPTNEIGRLVATAVSGIHFGVAINYPISGYISEYFGWEWVFYASGLSATIWYIFWIMCVTNSPSNHKWISTEERIYIESGVPQSATKGKNPDVPWKEMLFSRHFSSYVIHRFFMSWSASFLLMCVPLYIKGISNLDTSHVGLLCGLANMTTAIFIPFAAMLFDYIRSKKCISTSNIYKIYHAIGYLGSFVIFSFLGSLTNVAYIIASLVASRFLTVFVECTNYMLPVDISPRYSAILAGFGITIFSIGGTLNPIILGFIVSDFKELNQWNIYFILLVIINFLGFVTFTLFGTGEKAVWNDYSKKTNSDIKTHATAEC